MGPNSCRQEQNSDSINAAIPDTYRTYDELINAIKQSGVESLQCAFFYDFSKSNQWTGEKTYAGRSLHGTDYVNPYIHAVQIMAPIIPKFDDDGVLPAFRFGCADSKDAAVVPLCYPQNPNPHFNSVQELIAAYVSAVPTIIMSGPTTFAPIVEKAIEISTAYNHKQHLFIIIMTDGDVSNVEKDRLAFIKASSYPISFCALGFGDGPFQKMHYFDDMPGRRFDNFQFVNFTEIEQRCQRMENPELAMCTAMMQEIPQQYKFIRRLGLLQ